MHNEVGKALPLGLFSPVSASPNTPELLFPQKAAQLAGTGEVVVSQWENQGFGCQIRAGMAVEEDCDRCCSEQPGGRICRAHGEGRMAQRFIGVTCASYSSQDRDAGGIYSCLAEVAWLSPGVWALLCLNSLGSRFALLLQAESKKEPYEKVAGENLKR